MPRRPAPKPATNAATNPKYIGVRQRPERHGWLANAGGYALGQFPTAELAAEAYDRVARHLGFARERLNFPDRPLAPATVEQMRIERRALRKTTTTSRFHGVSWSTKHECFRATMRHGERTIFLGNFDDEVTAARHYDAVAYQLKGKAAKLNFPGERRLKIEIPTAHQKTSKYLGVRRAASGRWTAFYADAELRLVILGMWTDERDAAVAHDRAVLYFGRDRKLNFPRRALEPASPKEINAASRLAFKKTTSSQYRGVYASQGGSRKPNLTTWFVKRQYDAERRRRRKGEGL